MQSLWSWGPQGHICSSCRRECLRRTSSGIGIGIGAGIGAGSSVAGSLAGTTTRRTRPRAAQSRSLHAGELCRAASIASIPPHTAPAPGFHGTARRRPQTQRRTADTARRMQASTRPYSAQSAQSAPKEARSEVLREALQEAEQQQQKEQQAQQEQPPDARTVHERKLDDARADLVRIMRESIGPNFNLPVYLFPAVSGSKYRVKRKRREPGVSGVSDVSGRAEALKEDVEEDEDDDADDADDAGDGADSIPGLRPDEIPAELREYARYARPDRKYPATPVSLPAPTLANTRTVVSRFQVIDALSSICVSHAQLRKHEEKADQRDAYLSWLHKQFGLSRRWWLQRPKLTEGLDALGEALIEDEEAMQHTLLQGQREPQVAIQFNRMVDATNMLVDDLMMEAYRLWDPSDPDMAHRRMGNPDSAWNALRMLRIDGYPSYQLPDLDPEATVYARMAASAASRQVFANWLATLRYNTTSSLGRAIYNRIRYLRRTMLQSSKSKNDIKLRNAEEIHGWVAKLCFNILVSKSPPGIHNYHALIFGFTNLGLHTLAQIVADSLLLRTRFRPTQQTVALLLHQSRARGDMAGFYRTVRRIVALDSRGMKLRRRSVREARAGKPEFHEWARRSDINLLDGYVVQRTDVDGPVLSAILKGLLSLDQVRHATVVYAASLGDSAHVDARLLNTFLNAVLDSVDIPAARALVQVLAGNASLITPLLMPDVVDGRHVRAVSARKLAIKLRLLLSIAAAPEPPLQKWHHDSQMLVDFKPQKRIANPYMRQLQRRRRFLDQAQLQQEMRDAHVESGHVSGDADTPAAAKTGMSWDEFQYRNRTGTFKTTFAADEMQRSVRVVDDQLWDEEAERNHGAFRLTQALFVADTEQYLSRLDRILASAVTAARTSPAFAARADVWTIQLAHLAGQVQRQEREQDQYRRMAQLKAVEQMADAVFAACSHVMESFMATVTDDVAAIKTASIKRTVETGAPPVFQSILSCKTGVDVDADADPGTGTGTEAEPPQSILASVQSFLQRVTVPFRIRLAAFYGLTGLQGRSAVVELPASAGSKAADDPKNETADDNDDTARLSKQVAMLARHLDDDTPLVSRLLEGRLKDILTHSLVPDYYTTLTPGGATAADGAQTAVEIADARAQARAMPVEALVQTRLCQLQPATEEPQQEKQEEKQKQDGWAAWLG